MVRTINFQGNLKKKSYFEGWYYKQVSYDGLNALSLIPGITLSATDPHSFIQYIYIDHSHSEPKTTTGYIRFDLKEFIWNDAPFTAKIGDNLFSESLLSVHLEDEKMKIDGHLQLGTLTDIQRTPYMPTIMGPFSYVPKMECYHEVISMDHLLKGKITINGEVIDFTGGKGYIEKDWGTNFPKQYIWMQCNHFENTETSLFFSDAHIPFYGTEFQGFISAFRYQNKEYRFATYNKSQLEVVHPSKNKVQVVMENKFAKLTIHGESIHQGHLIAPVPTGMEKVIKEGISGKLSITFYNKKTKETYTDTGQMAGIEIVEIEG